MHNSPVANHNRHMQIPFLSNINSLCLVQFMKGNGSQRGEFGLFLLCISAINALYFVHRALYAGEDGTFYVMYIKIY